MDDIKKERIKNIVKRYPVLYDLALFIAIKEERIRFVLQHIVHWPRWHCDYLRRKSTLCGYGYYPRTKKNDLNNPTLLDDKLLWLKYYKYNNDELVAKCYDKYLVREYVEECGCGHILNQIYGVWDDVNKIPFSDLPDEYVLKKTNSYGDHVFKYKNEAIDIKKAVLTLSNNERMRIKLFTATGDLFATRNKQLYICEKMLGSELGYKRPEDYKFYCFNGEPKYLAIMWDRKSGSEYHETFKKVDFSDQSNYWYGAKPAEIQKPICYNEMLEICRKLSAPFPFVRVDLYEQNSRPVFGELTFTPAGGQILYHVFDDDMNINYEALEIMGKQLDLKKYNGGR